METHNWIVCRVRMSSTMVAAWHAVLQEHLRSVQHQPFISSMTSEGNQIERRFSGPSSCVFYVF